MGNYLYIIIFLTVLVKVFFNKDSAEKQNTTSEVYIKKRLMTDCEYNFYQKLCKLGNNYKIIPQLNLASIIKKPPSIKNYLDLYRNIDFAIFNSDYSQILLLIELNDKTHNNKRRIKRDIKVKKICNKAKIPLISFYTNYSNEDDYVINRVLNNLQINKNKDD